MCLKIKEESMGKTIRSNDPRSKKFKKKKNLTQKGVFEHGSKNRQQKDNFPNRVWPTGQEKHKGHKI
jgi:hypothetical protein